MMPVAITAATAVPALCTSGNEAMTSWAQGGRGMSFTVTSVTIISRPSDPMVSASRSRPGPSGARPPNSSGSPSIV